MDELMRRRRALMAEQWEDITDQLSFTSGTGVARSITGNDIRVYTTSDGPNRQILAPFETSPLYTYKATCDSITVTSGTGRMAVRTPPPGTVTYIARSPEWTTSQGKTVWEFDHDTDIGRLSLLCTSGTSEAGDVTYHNFKLWRKKG